MTSLTTENLDLSRITLARKPVMHRTDSERLSDRKALLSESLREELERKRLWNRYERALDPEHFPTLIPRGTFSPWRPRACPKQKRMGRIRRNGEFVGGKHLGGLKVHSVPKSEEYQVKPRVEVSRKAHWLPPSAVGSKGKGRIIPTKQVESEHWVQNPRSGDKMRVKCTETVEVDIKTGYVEGKLKLPHNDLTSGQNRDIACSSSRRRWGKYRNARS